ncbi:hypothetical protein ACXR2U_21165 [Jatrophihabitans sp. YIM 134969]
MPLRPALLSAAAVIVALCTTAAPAAATAAPRFSETSRPIVGDLTADHRPDVVTLGRDTTSSVPSCAARVRPGKKDGSTSTTGAFRPLPVRGSMVVECPDLGVVLPGPTAAAARLAVTWSSVAPIGGKSVQFFRWAPATQRWTWDGATNAMFQPSSLTTQDLDGDGFGDLVERTDQGSGVEVYTGRASTYRLLWTSAPSALDDLAFADFDHGRGVDILDAHAFYSGVNVGVTVVDGSTGTAVQLVADTAASPASYEPEAVDVNGDGWLDVRVQVTADDGTPRPDLVFRNRANGRLAFTRV